MRRHTGENILLQGVWKKIFRCQHSNEAHANTHWRKIFLLAGVWKMIFRCQQLDRAHANTYWRKTFLLPGVWKKIFHCQQAEHENSNILCVKPYCCWECGKNFPGPDTSTDTCEHTLGCWLLSFSYANTHWIENHFCCFWCRMFFGRSRGLTRSKNSCQCFYCCEKPHCCCS